MPRDSIDDFNDAIRYAFEQQINQSITVPYNRYNNSDWYCDRTARECEVCGEPVDNECGGHLRKRCRAAAKKYRNALTDREVELGGY